MSRLAIRTLCSFTCLALLLIAGCINYDQQLEMNANGSGKLVMHYSMASAISFNDANGRPGWWRR